jgi:hypothetical protein
MEPPEFGLAMSENVKKSLLAACRHLLHPLVRMLLRNGVNYGEFADAVRGAYIDIASTEILSAEQAQSDARIGIVTGMNAREVGRIRENDANAEPEVSANQIARVLQGWSQEQDYLGPYGLPLEVPFAGERPSFEDLVNCYAEGAPPRILLGELVRVGAAVEISDGYVRMLNRTYVPSPLDPVGLERFGNIVNYFIDTVDANMQKKRQGEGQFERFAMTMEGLSPSALAEFDLFVREKGQEFLEIIDDWIGEHEIKGGHKLPPDRSIRTGVGVFQVIDRFPPEPEGGFRHD